MAAPQQQPQQRAPPGQITHVLFDMVRVHELVLRYNARLRKIPVDKIKPTTTTTLNSPPPPTCARALLVSPSPPHAPLKPKKKQDGLLLDTETHYTTAQKKVLEPLGVEFTFELKAMMMGKRAYEAAEALIAATGLSGRITPEEFVEAREAILDGLFPTSELMPGAGRLVEHLRASGVPAAVATSSHRRHFDAKTSHHSTLFSRCFSHVVTGDQVERGKPHPDIFLKAASLFAEPPADPSSVLVFEDAPSGVEAARAAGYRVVLVPDARLPEHQRLGACEVLPSLLDFDPVAWGLPGYLAE